MLTRRLRPTVLLVALLGLGIAPGVAAQEYTIGPKDVLKITVWGHEDLSKDYPVGADGFVPFPLIGRAQASGLTTQQFAAQLRELLEKDYLVNPQVLVAVSQYLSKKVHVLGEAERAGSFYLTGPTTVLEIVSKAGLGKQAGQQIVVLRKAARVEGRDTAGNVIMRLDLAKIQAGDSTENLHLEDEDTLFIPKGHAFFVLGEVKSAGTFALDKPTSVLEAITLAGGFNERAAPSGAKIVRRGADGRQETIALDLSGSVPKDRDVPVQSGDTILVPKGNSFFVFGEVQKPGSYQLDKGTNVLEAIILAGGFNERAAPSGAKIVRRGAEGRQETIALDLSGGVPKDRDVPVQSGDTILVPKGDPFFVLGEVQKPGLYQLDKGTNVLEAITLAGGFNERAAPSGAKIVRRGADGRQETIALDLSGSVPKDRDVALQSGDTILVPKGNTFFVLGEVRKPGSYQLDKGTNVLEGITLAGGFTDKAAPGRVRVIRNTPTGQRVIEVDVNDIMKRGNREKAIALQENDVVVVPESFF